MLIRLFAGLSVVLLLCACHSPAPSVVEPAVTLYHGGSILSLEGALRFDVMAVAEGRILDLGDEGLLKHYPDAAKVDLAGATVLPGMIDSHVHVRELGENLIKADLRGTTTVDAMIAILKQRYPKPEPGVWLIGHGWDEGVWASQGYPDRAALDAAYPENPVALSSLHGFAAFYNASALAVAGIDAATPNPEGGTILRRDDQSATGVLLTNARYLVNQHIPALDPAATRAAILTGLNTLAAAGVTAVHEAGMDGEQLAAFRELAASGKLPIRVYGMLNGNDRPLMEQWFAQGPLLDSSDFFTVRSIKVFYDGSLGSRTALLAKPYHDHPDKAHPTERIAPEAVTWLAENAAEKGFQMAVHAIGDEANRRVLDIYEAALKDTPDHRWRIEHAQVVLPDYYTRAAKLGVISSMQPSHAVGDSGWAEARLGPDRIREAYAWRKILAAGGRLALNSDLPGEPWQPMQTLYFAVTRRKLNGEPPAGWYPDQALSVMESLHGMTAAGAHAAFQEARLGTLAKGKHADFIALDRDPTRVPAEELASIRVLKVWVGGRLVTQVAGGGSATM
ncbi:amidohydrolase [Acanthopleuribacter pedis]|uniref:Amidohydrolase n=1 Tax=Acanthopleuribacter pedis TaxID=442870 RepID=A0A8J7QGG5_9BACT|nr:amidohydrolase [Acanthopleuribacter pedis]MBO1318100.1 amidohydrolase [Acanthopleuribacter pedis]